jgi:4-hydroxy-2-oxoheptanedioate aldolase
MTTTTNTLKLKLAAGKPVIGIWSIISSPVIVEIFALAGLDFVILDMEHGIYDVDALDSCVRACEAGGAAPVVRVPGMNASAVQWALDLGAHGIIVPQVAGFAQTDTAVKMAKFAPEGTRGYNPFTRAGQYSNPSSNTGGKLNNAFGLTSVIIENENSLAELDRICTLPNLDVIYIGVYDLAVALGCAGNTSDPRIQDIVRSCVTTIRAAGKAAGVMVRSGQEITQDLAIGANFLVYSVDTYVIRQAVEGAVQAFQQQATA